ncbi:MAG: SLC13 family permease, partial [Rhodospirillales bacterium]|nr:SLC13 family permease [Rhodospirillales bacterium]
MTLDQALLAGLVVVLFTLFLWGRWRYDLVAFFGLVAAVGLGLVPASEAFLGFGHPATVTVAAVLVISAGLANAGLPDAIGRLVAPLSRRVETQVAALSGIGGLLSGFMNNVGALALLMPVAIQTAVKTKRPVGIVLMPLAFGSILGGLVTLIGTPPNVIIATFRAQATGTPFGLFDFTPVGGAVAVAGILFVATIGWRLIPVKSGRDSGAKKLVDIDDFIAEVRVPRGNAIVGKSVRELEAEMDDHDVLIIGLVRRDQRLPGRAVNREIRASDILIVEAGREDLDKFASDFRLRIVGAEADKRQPRDVKELSTMEVVVAPTSALVGREAETLRIRSRYGVNLLGVSRRGEQVKGRIRSFRLGAGDVLLLEGEPDAVAEAVSRLGLLPLNVRDTPMGIRRKLPLSIAIFATAIGVAVSGLAPFPIALSAAALLMVVFEVVTPRELYTTVDWPVIVLLGAMIPVGGALETTGAAALLVDTLMPESATIPAVAVLAVILVVTMTLSDVLNNAATAVIMAPIAMVAAERSGNSPDPFLMAVAIGASCAFLTPIGHQNNALIMGPGGYAFGDYWR